MPNPHAAKPSPPLPENTEQIIYEPVHSPYAKKIVISPKAPASVGDREYGRTTKRASHRPEQGLLPASLEGRTREWRRERQPIGELHVA